MVYGEYPFFTKGPLAIFYGGEKILQDLSNQPPEPGVRNLLMGSVLFQLIFYLYDKYHRLHPGEVTHYIEDLKKSIITNILNLYGVTLMIIFNMIGFVFILSHYLRVGRKEELENKVKLVPNGIIVLTILFCAVVLWPYRSFALRYVAFVPIQLF